MEHRHCKRIPTALRTLIHRQGESYIAGITRNLSPDGAFVEISHAAFAHGSGVEIKFIEGVVCNLQLRGLTVHTNHIGVGIMFSDFDTTTRYALREAVRHLRSGQY